MSFDYDYEKYKRYKQSDMRKLVEEEYDYDFADEFDYIFSDYDDFGEDNEY